MFSLSLILLLTAGSCVFCIDLIQPDSMVVQPGQSLTITCRPSGYSLTGVSVCMVVCVLPCNGLATCPGCTLPLARRLLEIGTSFPVTHYGISGRK
ncbi:hypothetical protein ATANTOWER_022050 [Ataeniobius toweri]|uniref:Uncharacterized protein n=1 Tax=Ataeniobius toweri TaxID=208326 RepID=A0ABU7B7Y6_9TELE|nr:hypothetical protein [Ataeniobius toweri]